MIIELASAFRFFGEVCADRLQAVYEKEPDAVVTNHDQVSHPFQLRHMDRADASLDSSSRTFSTRGTQIHS